ncbi:hypothetical protein V8C86DRAFT_2672390, partial [Haematococcus lacustris]
MLAGRARVQGLPPCRTTLVIDAIRTGPAARRGSVTAAARRRSPKNASEATEGRSSEGKDSPARPRIAQQPTNEPHNAAMLSIVHHLHGLIQQLQHSQQQWVQKISPGLCEFEAAACRWYQDMTNRFVRVDMVRREANTARQQVWQRIRQLETELKQKEEDMEETMAALQQAEAEWQSSEQRVQSLSTAQQAAKQQLGNARQQVRQLQGEQRRQRIRVAKGRHELLTKVEAAQAVIKRQQQKAIKEEQLRREVAFAQDLAREREEMEMMEERLSAANAAEEDTLADMRTIKVQLSELMAAAKAVWCEVKTLVPGGGNGCNGDGRGGYAHRNL